MRLHELLTEAKVKIKPPFQDKTGAWRVRITGSDGVARTYKQTFQSKEAANKFISSLGSPKSNQNSVPKPNIGSTDDFKKGVSQGRSAVRNFFKTNSDEPLYSSERFKRSLESVSANAELSNDQTKILQALARQIKMPESQKGSLNTDHVTAKQVVDAVNRTLQANKAAPDDAVTIERFIRRLK